MSKKAAIHLAIATQLAIEDKPPLDLRGRLRADPLPDPGQLAANANAAAVLAHETALRDYGERLRSGSHGPGFDADATRSFLAKVAFLLRTDDPPLKFNWSKINPADARDCQFWALIDMIAEQTVGLDEKAAADK
jgi:hypothetical protein